MLEIRNLSKSYGKKVALNNINLKFDNGLYGLLIDLPCQQFYRCVERKVTGA